MTTKEVPDQVFAALSRLSRRNPLRRAAGLGIAWLPGVCCAAIIGAWAPAAELRLAEVSLGQVAVSCREKGDSPHLCEAPSGPFRQMGTVPFFQPVKNRSWSACGFVLLADAQGPQVAVMSPAGGVAVCVRGGESVEVSVPIKNVSGAFSISARVDLLAGDAARVGLALDGQSPLRTVKADEALTLRIDAQESRGNATLRMKTAAESGEVVVRWRDLQVAAGGGSLPVTISPAEDVLRCPPPEQPPLRGAMEPVLVEWDWRMQDGIGTERLAVPYAAAVKRLFEQGDALLARLRVNGIVSSEETRQWEELRSQWQRLAADRGTAEDAWEALWRRSHQLRRRIVLENPLAHTGPIVFAKHVAGGLFSHQLTQYQGDNARPGGGIFVLEEPGRTMRTRQLAAGALPQGASMHPEVSPDGRHVLFAYCQVDSDPPGRARFLDRHFHLYQVDADGGNLRQLTAGPYDDFSPRYLPGGRIVLISTRRGGYHRCGQGPCPVYTLAMCEADGSSPRTISFHETHEWDPAVLNDGRVIYTRWDYVDRNAVNFEQLWTIRPDGSGPRAFYGNNTLNPIGVWEARPVPGSPLVMATAAAHHAMTAGAIILLDVTKGAEDLAPITRFTPDAPFPESESPAGSMGEFSAAQRKALRWPGHCYRSPYPLSEDCCLAAYSYDSLVGEPRANRPNMFGLYLLDRFGNKELLYRDLCISSVWPMPLRPRGQPPMMPSTLAAGDKAEGTFFLQNVYESWVPLPKERIVGLRIIQVLPKTTPHANTPKPGLAGTSPGKQVLGTVPVEQDGSACFRAPARIPLQFQALDSQGRAVQMMYSLVYLQPGETAGCAGCHERNAVSPPVNSPASAEALRRPPSAITPGPDGSKPLSYPLLVQPVLDKHCVTCHGPDLPKEKSGGIVLTGQRGKGSFSRSYDALAPRVPFSAWENRLSTRTYPDQYGARASPLMKLLLAGHHEARLSKDDLARIITWMDANALFYGTFNFKDQERQLKGERIAGPDLE